MNEGTLDLIIGNMFSGKSTELIRRINKTRSINKNIIIINYLEDNRYSSEGSTEIVCTHDLNSVNCIKLKNLMDFDFTKLNDIDYLFIDEAQFFKDLYQFVKLLVDTNHKKVTVSGLAGDINRSEFGQLLKLIPIADTVVKLNAYCTVCKDGTIAPFTKKINEVNKVIDNDIDIGGSDKYISVCRTHFF